MVLPCTRLCIYKEKVGREESKSTRSPQSVCIIGCNQAPGNPSISERNQGVLDWDKQKRWRLCLAVVVHTCLSSKNSMPWPALHGGFQALVIYFICFQVRCSFLLQDVFVIFGSCLSCRLMDDVYPVV
eukprot:XP_008645107.1 uncharacterized protein LOC103626475 [Zea mays]